MKVGVLVNTCDRFDDCWDLFFRKWQRHKNGLNWPLYLNTEKATYQYPEDLQGHALAVCTPKPGYEGWTGEGFPTWSWCVQHALSLMPEELVLYMQEDYFLTGDINTEKLQDIADLMEQNPDIDCIHLTLTHCVDCKYTTLKRTSVTDPYFVSCQPAIWRKATLMELLQEHEDAWEFERWGTYRARALRCRFYTAAMNGSLISYFCTGVVQGKWLHPVEQLFAEEALPMDFSRRGFWTPRRGIRQNFSWLLEKIKIRMWPPKSIVSVINALLSPKRRSSYLKV